MRGRVAPDAAPSSAGATGSVRRRFHAILARDAKGETAMRDVADDDLEILTELERKILWLSTWTIHHANLIRPNADGLKVGGHQASSASLATLMTVLYMRVLRPEDRVAVKPHASPAFHAIQYLLGAQTREKLESFRALGGAQSYPSRTKDVDDVDFSTGSVGLGGAMALFAALIQDYVAAKGWSAGEQGSWPRGRMIALLGDAELDEGNLYEALLEGRKHGLRNCWWFIDYNRQSLDAATPDRQNAFFGDVFRAMGWDVVELKYGRQLQQAFAEPGGDRLRAWIDACPNQLYGALTYRGGAAWRARLMDEIGDQGDATALLDRRDDAALAELMTNLAGHDAGALLEALETVDHDRPVCFVTYTVKGHGLPLAGHKDNHAGLMTAEQMTAFRAAHGVREGREWEPFEGLPRDPGAYRAFLDAVPFVARGRRRLSAPVVPVPALPTPRGATTSTQKAFGQILDRIARDGGPLAERVLTSSPDVTVSTNLGPWVNRAGLFARDALADTYRDEGVGSMQKWGGGPGGRHLELGISEMNLFSVMAAAGLSHSLFGQRILPVGTLYDPFIERGKDMLNYACYQDARFLLAATPSGVTLAPEGGAHQSIGTPLIGLSQDGLASFEPAFADELAAIMGWAFDYMQRDGEAATDPEGWLRDARGGSVYLRLTTRQIDQPRRAMDDALRAAIIDGGYWLRPPSRETRVAIAYSGAMAPEAQAAADRLGERAAVLAVTSADRLHAGWQAADRARALGRETAVAPVERLLAPLNRGVALVTVCDAHPLTLGWLGSVWGHRVRPLGVEHFGQTGTIADVHALHRIDADAVVAAAQVAAGSRPFRTQL
jgi:pyruvate dehydrogenase E1 component